MLVLILFGRSRFLLRLQIFESLLLLRGRRLYLDLLLLINDAIVSDTLPISIMGTSSRAMRPERGWLGVIFHCHSQIGIWASREVRV